MRVLLTGNEAVARGAYEAGVKVAAGYPGTPSTEILENLVKYQGVEAQWAPNEKVALEVGFGASLAGVRSLVTMKHVGLNVAADPFMTLSYTGVNGGLVVITTDDPGMHSSQNEQDNRYYARFAKVPLIEPSDSQESKDFLKEAFLLSEKYDTPVLFRMTTRVSHTRTPVMLGQREEQEREFSKHIAKYVMLPAYARGRHDRVEARKEQLVSYAENSPLNQVFWGGLEVGVITSGITFHYAREALGSEVSYLKLGITNPLPLNLIREFASRVHRLVVIEELDPFLEEQITAAGIPVSGKDIFPAVGELSPAIIEQGLQSEPTFRAYFINTEPLPGRPPLMCPGCPHRGVFYTLHKLKAVVTGDIGCYTLGALPPFEAMDSCLCMGASIGAALGMEKAKGKEFARKVVAVIGDSTFIHSGITALIDHVYNKSTGTIIILDNRTTAMTGHQDHPATGLTLKRETTQKLNLVKLVESLGVEHVFQVDPYDLEALETLLRREMDREALSVVLASRPCALIEKDSKAAPPVVSDDCKGCRKCLKLGCPALFSAGGRVGIDETICRGCGLCLQICPQEAIKVREKDE